MQLNIHGQISDIAVKEWDALAGGQPFLRHAFLQTLEQTGCVGEGTGWQPLHATLRDDAGALQAAMPLYIKQHSWGEYVFDWAWADASQRAGLPYYPKLLGAIPFTPVPGIRLLGNDPACKSLLLGGIMDLAGQYDLSGVHILFPPADDAGLFEAAGLMPRHGVQFHWHNRQYRDYTEFLGSLSHDKRKKLKQERRKAAESGLRMVRKVGSDISEADWQFFYQCYCQTYLQHRSSPYLTLPFFLRLAETLGQHCLLVMALDGNQPVAAALNLFDGERLYGRYWGAKHFVPSLHFELCYHQGIEFAIERGLQVFEGGAQGEHKLARGFEAV
ncbi:GNAT family N-acetyltransferase, partial [Chitinimonas sp.]|uniref:GNAT family N-acetyltransferase n=1 Tax=Chitinimonas sp. TaxID=1934313 RepID=UPI0035B305A1